MQERAPVSSGFEKGYAQTTLQTGYTVVRPDEGTQMPVGTAVFSFTNPDGVRDTAAGVGAVEPIAPKKSVATSNPRLLT